MDPVQAQEICFSGLPDIIYLAAGTVTTVMSSGVLANFVKPKTFVGKLIHYLALNFRVATVTNKANVELEAKGETPKA